MNYPLDLSFKILALTGQIYVRDASGMLVAFVKQKFLKLKEDINIYADEQQTQLLYNIKADRIIDWSAKYTFTDANGQVLGAVKRQGMRSIWRASYDIFNASDSILMKINELNPWAKMGDACLSEVPILGIFSGYLFHPSYVISREGTQTAILQKQPAFFESKFKLSEVKDLSSEDEQLVLLAVLTMTILERGRG